MMKPFLESEQQLEKSAEFLDVDKPVEVYFNLQKKCWSVRQDGIVRYHTNYVFMRDAEFKVSQKGRDRVLREKRKNVHAVIKGFLHTPTDMPKAIDAEFTYITYNPYKYHSFVRTDTEHSVKTAKWVDMMIDESVMAWRVA